MTPNETDSDETLAALSGRGDKAAFEIIVRRHKAELYRFVRRYIGQNDDAYDVLQDALLAAWSSASRYDPSRPFLPWLRTIALNKCRDFGRRRRVRQLLLRARAAEPDEATTVAESTDATLAGEERLRRLDKAIAELAAFYKEPLLLTTVSGLSHQQAAELLKTTPKAIEMRIYRAKRKLAVRLGEKNPEG